MIKEKMDFNLADSTNTGKPMDPNAPYFQDYLLLLEKEHLHLLEWEKSLVSAIANKEVHGRYNEFELNHTLVVLRLRMENNERGKLIFSKLLFH